MTIALAFWIVMLLWLVLDVTKQIKDGGVRFPGWLPFLAVALIGWHVFGAAVHQ